MDKKIELLAPAGDLERLKINLLYGADAVYLGGYKYNLRANATNFSLEEIKEGCKFAHDLNKKVYVTLNISFHNDDLDGLDDYINQVVVAGIDAFIVSDPFLIPYIKNKYLNVEVHLSTQNGACNYKAVDFYKAQGIDRVVLARELSLGQIEEVIDKTHVDIEVFIHGAMCTCFSGRCALSNYVTNRDANRGGCAQVCRFAFKCNEEKDFTMATKDLNTARLINEFKNMGVKSLKVEGRMRSIYYLATVIGTYREIIDRIDDNSMTEEIMQTLEQRLSRVANREVSTHYLTHEADFSDQYYTGRQELSNQDYLGLITGYDDENKCLILIERNYFEPGDEVEIFTPDREFIHYTVGDIYDENMNLLDVARHPEQVLKLKFEKSLPKYSMIRLIKKGN